MLKELNVIKSKLSDFKVGDEVLCYWGSGGYDQEGIVVDPLVNYNGFMLFTEEECEPACIIRFKNTTLPTDFKTGLNCVVPHRQIKHKTK